MRLIIANSILYFGLICHSVYSQDPPALATPSPVQYEWHEQERIMFKLESLEVCKGVIQFRPGYIY